MAEIPLLRRVRGAFGAALGPLEREILEALWRRDAPASVRDLCGSFPGLAYTTLMTTLERLHRKGVLDRVREGKAFLYRARLSRDELLSLLATETVGALLGTEGPGTRPVLSCFVDAVGRKDRRLLGELERLVRAAREASRKGER